MERIVPVLQIDEYDEAIDFYVSRLGFSIFLEHRHEPGFPVFMVIKRGDLTISLSEHGKGHQGSEIYVVVDDLESWYSQCLDTGVKIEHPPEKMPWGSTEMLVIDPFRNALRFAQEKTHEGHATPNKPK